MQLQFVIRQLYEVLATHAMAYRKELGHGLALILVETWLCYTSLAGTGKKKATVSP